MLRDRLDDALLADVLAEALAGGGDFAEVYAEHRDGRSLRLEDRRIEEVTSGVDLGAGVRVVTGDQVGYAYTNLLDRESLTEAAGIAAAAVRGQSAREIADLTRPERRVHHPVKQYPLAVDRERLVELATRADQGAREVSGEVAQVVVRYSDVDQHVLIATSEGELVDDRRTRTRMAAQVIAARDDLIQTGLEAPGTFGGHELFEAHPPAAIGRAAAERAVTMLDSRPAPTGQMPVVVWRGDAGVLFHEACGHGMEGDMIAKEASVFAGLRGEKIASELVSGVDDGTVVNGWGSFAFDDEGSPAARTVLFDDGVLGDYLTDRRRSRELGLAPTGNGRRESYAHLPVPRMSTTYILPGESTPDEAVESLDRGILCKGMGGGQVNTATGDFVFGTTECYLVEDGEIAYPVRGVNLVGNALEVLESIDLVAHDVDFKQGTCGKDGQMVPAGIGAPTIRIARLTVGGTGE